MENKTTPDYKNQLLSNDSEAINTNQMMYLAVESSPNGMIMSDEKGFIVLVNSATEQMFGYSREELIGKPLETLIPERYKEQHPFHRKFYYQSPTSRAMGKNRNLFGLHKSGDEFPVEIGLNPIKTEKGIYVLAAVVDITDRKYAEEMMYLAVEASPNGMVMMDEKGKIILVNSTTEKLFQYSRDELIGQPIEILVPERFRKKHPGLRSSYFVDLKARAMGQGRDLYGRRKNDEEFPVEIGLNPISTRQGPLVLAAIVDITERKRAEKMMKLAVEASPNGMVLTDNDGIIVMVNSTTESIFGYSRDELVGTSITNLVPHRFRTKHPILRKEYYDNPRARAMGHGRDLFGLHKNGDEIPVEIGLNPISTNQGVMILASVVDITERKSQESLLLDALKEKELMLAEIHHRVKNNLQIIDSLLGIQSDKVEDDDSLEILKECQNRVKSMAVIHQTLYESKNFASVNFGVVIETLLDNLSRSYSNQTSNISYEVKSDEIKLPLNISIPIGLILNELCTNVMKHAYVQELEGALRVNFYRESPTRIILDVEDDGKGIPEDLDYQNNKSMGLLLVHVLSEQIGAELEINYSEPTRFRLKFTEEK